MNKRYCAFVKRNLAGILAVFMLVMQFTSVQTAYAQEANDAEPDTVEASDTEEPEGSGEESVEDKTDGDALPSGETESDTTVQDEPQMKNLEEQETENPLPDEDQMKISETDTDVASETDKRMNYVTIASSNLYTPDTQYIVFSAGDDGDELTTAQITVRNRKNGQEETYSMDWHEGNAAVFVAEYMEAYQSGIYDLIRAAYEIQGKTYLVTFAEAGLEVYYGVNQEVVTKPDAVADETASEEIQNSIAAYDQNGNEVSGASISSALENASEQTPGVMSARSGGNIVIVLDPGHDNRHLGAHSKNGEWKEEEINFKIALFCKAELDKYSGITAYMTRTSFDCPHPGTTAGEDNRARVDYAASVGADFYISFHINSSESSQPSGVEVYYPNANYNYGVHLAGKDMAQKVLNNLVALGLVNRGTKIRNSEAGDTYADGSLADYLAVIRRSKQYGIPSILIEHAFISHLGDAYNYLKTDEQLKRLGIADANAIVSYFGLTKEKEYTSADLTMTPVLDGTQTAFGVTMSGIPDCHAVKLAVWSDVGGQDDLAWYPGQKQENGDWIAFGPVSNHRAAGLYYAHAYIFRSDGTCYYMGGTSFSISPPTAKAVRVTGVNDASGDFTLRAEGIVSAAGITTAQIAVWSQANQSDLHWYTAQRQNDGTYVVKGNVANHNNNYGKYQAHLYLTDRNGITAYAASASFTVKAPQQGTKVAVTPDQSTAYIEVNTSASYGGQAIRDIRCAVWSDENGQDDLVWYQAYKESNAVWRSMADIGRHKTAGRYSVHTYGTLANGRSVCLSTTAFSVKGPSASGLTLTGLNEPNGDFALKLNQASGDVAGVRVAVWSSPDQSDLHWYTAWKEGSSYVLGGNIAYHKYKYGNYQAHAYVTSKAGITAFGGGVSFTVKAPAQSTVAAVTPDQSTAYIEVNTNAVYGGQAIRDIRCAVWSDANGQDDLVWYQAYKESNAVWRSMTNTKNHRTAGQYSVHTYGTLANGRSVCLSTTTFTIQGPRASSVAIAGLNEEAGTFQVRVSGINAAAGIAGVQVPVWSQGNQSDIIWYNATRTGNGEYVVYADIRNHGNNLGWYQAHAYITDGNGIAAFVGADSCSILRANNAFYNITGSTTITPQQMARYYRANASYPTFYATSDAPTIEHFCQIYYEECMAEGIKAEVAFAQAMKETGFLRFGGDVKIEQYNFAGLGATGNGAPGHAFSSVREGVRAQVQHLKAYANSDALNNFCVDPRFKRVTPRGCAPFVEWLGQKENPFGKGWATSPGYGYSIKNDYIARLLQY